MLRELREYERGSAQSTSRRSDSILVWRKRTRIWGSCSNARAGSTRLLVCLKRAIELDPADPDFREFLGDLYVDRLDFLEAIHCYRTSIAISRRMKRPGCTSRWDGRFRKRAGLAEALDQYREAQRIQPGLAAVFTHLGRLP